VLRFPEGAFVVSADARRRAWFRHIDNMQSQRIVRHVRMIAQQGDAGDAAVLVKTSRVSRVPSGPKRLRCGARRCRLRRMRSPRNGHAQAVRNTRTDADAVRREGVGDIDHLKAFEEESTAT